LAREHSRAEDLTSEAYRRALLHLPKYEDRGKPFEAWLFTIVRNLARDGGRAEPGDRAGVHLGEVAGEVIEIVPVERRVVESLDVAARHDGRVGDVPAVERAEHGELHQGDDGGRTDREARFLVVGSKAPHEVCTYSDVDLVLEVKGGAAGFAYKDGTPWTGPR
jgi:uncharacterized cupin superfamily protein